MSEVPYQLAPQIEALQQERANCVAYGNDKRIAAIDRSLAELGVKQEAAQERAAAAAGDADAKSAAPRGRRSKEATQASDASAGSGGVTAPDKE